MVHKIDLSNPVSIEVKDAGFKTDNFKTIEFKEGTGHSYYTYTYLEISDENFNELGQRMYPDGLIPDDFHKKIALVNQLIEELDIRDKENPDWRISKVEYLGGEDDMIQFDTKEIEK